METGFCGRVLRMEIIRESAAPVRRPLPPGRKVRTVFEVVDGKLECSTCHEVKPTDAFYKHKTTRSGFATQCKSCIQGAMSAARSEDNRPFRGKALKHSYNITIDQYEEMLREQGGVCAVCRRPEEMKRNGVVMNLAVDHDHACCPGKRSCGKCVRGLVCWWCNKTLTGIDRVGSVDSFSEYLARQE